PRILKRVKSLENDFEIVLIYWDRGQPIREPFEIDKKNKVVKIYIKAPLGKPIARIIPLIIYFLRVIRILKREKPDIIHAGNLDMLFIASIYKCLFNKNTKIIYEVADLPKYAFIREIKSFRSLVARLLQHV